MRNTVEKVWFLRPSSWDSPCPFCCHLHLEGQAYQDRLTVRLDSVSLSPPLPSPFSPIHPPTRDFINTYCSFFFFFNMTSSQSRENLDNSQHVDFACSTEEEEEEGFVYFIFFNRTSSHPHPHPHPHPLKTLLTVYMQTKGRKRRRWRREHRDSGMDMGSAAAAVGSLRLHHP